MPARRQRWWTRRRSRNATPKPIGNNNKKRRRRRKRDRMSTLDYKMVEPSCGTCHAQFNPYIAVGPHTPTTSILRLFVFRCFCLIVCLVICVCLCVWVLGAGTKWKCWTRWWWP
jgi:hypothetical protein